ncbi:MAG TPA: acetyl-CoA hydrolase/transferase C-terminal domain-containing protein [Nocardioidaceae bacterium]|nr:acetyl-CoA hydrolase/transferase C-terminal domain-containing protein [Nocardioidaceae bacterium]
MPDPFPVELSTWIRPGDTVIWGQSCAEPLTLTSALFAQRHEIGPFRCFLGIPASDTVQPEYADAVSFLSYCGTGSNRKLYDAGVLDIVTSHYSTFATLFQQLPIDVALVQVSPANPDGTYSMGLAHEYLGSAIDVARVVIAEVNDQLPTIAGTRQLRPDEIDVLVPVSYRPLELFEASLSDVSAALGRQVAAVIPDGATLQLGIGSLSQSVTASLYRHRDLHIHSGMISNGVLDLVDAGVVKGEVVGGVLMGTMRLFERVAGDASFQLRPTSYTHSLEVMGGIDRFVSINGAVEVDLLGQINTERVGSSYVGAIGGGLDFARGAAASPGGIPIIGLPSSRIVPRLTVPASVPAVEAGVIVTEYGAADLRGRSLPERAELLIGIAHPDNRDSLGFDRLNHRSFN